MRVLAVLVIVPIAALAIYLLAVRGWHDARIALAFVPATCQVLDKRFAAGATRRFAQPEIEVLYRAHGRDVRSRGFDDRGSWKATQLMSRARAAEILEHFAVGRRYPCWHDPQEASRVVLAPGRAFLLPIALVVGLALPFAVGRLGRTSLAGRLAAAGGLAVLTVLLAWEPVEDWLRGWPNPWLLAPLALLAAFVAAFALWAPLDALRRRGRGRATPLP